MYKLGKFWVCLDLRFFNKVIKVEYCFMLKIDVVIRLNKCKGIYGFGCYKNGFWKVVLDDSLRFLISFNIFFSGYWWKGMWFGIKLVFEVW